jgi:hypothetical protein
MWVNARAAGSREGIQRVADAFGLLGAVEMSARVRAMAAAR